MREPELSAVCGRTEEGFFDFAAARTGKRSEEQGRGHFAQNDTSLRRDEDAAWKAALRKAKGAVRIELSAEGLHLNTERARKGGAPAN
jgi:hypothetical protein